jgi:BNR repeat-containing family member
MTIHTRLAALGFVLALMCTALCYAESPKPIASDALGGTLARDHQSRAMYFDGQHRRTYLTYLDHDFNARVTHYDHDAGTWAEPVIVDDCIAEVGWCKGIKDGHNAPNLWVSKTGTIHLIYGSHGTPFKYARSTQPESIDQWELGTRLSNYGTYPFVAELPDGEMLMFYRYSPTGGYKDPFLGLQRTKDDGKTWTPVQKLGAFRKACKLNGRNAVYDPKSKRIHLSLALIPNGSWTMYPCQYDPAAGQMYSWNGTTELGDLPGDDAVVEHCRVDGLSLQELFVHDGILYLLLKRGGGHAFAVWDGETLARYDIPKEKTKWFSSGPIWTTDGKHVRIFGLRETEPATEFSGRDLYVWTSTDGGKTWDDGRCLMDRRELGHGLGGVNRVTNYPGHGPLLVVAEDTAKLPEEFDDTPQTHYDNPWRKNKRLYALAEEDL